MRVETPWRIFGVLYTSPKENSYSRHVAAKRMRRENIEPPIIPRLEVGDTAQLT